MINGWAAESPGRPVNCPLVVVMIALLIQWTRSDRRTAKRLDRAADRDNDADLAAYNAMLAEMARRDGQSR